MKYLKYIIIIIVIIVSWVFTSDISFFEEIIKPEDCTSEPQKIKPEDSQLLKSLEKASEAIWNNKYIILGTVLVLVIGIIIIQDFTAIINKPLISDIPTLERGAILLDNMPRPPFQSWDHALFMYPELQATQNSDLLPLFVESKGVWTTQPFTTPDGTWRYTSMIYTTDNVLYRVYMDYSIPITTIVNPADFVNEGSCVVTNVILVDPMLIHSAPYTMVEAINVTGNSSVVIDKPIFIKRF